MKFTAEVLDTWNMTVTPVDGVFTLKKKDNYFYADKDGRSIALPGKPYMAIRIKRVKNDMKLNFASRGLIHDDANANEPDNLDRIPLCLRRWPGAIPTGLRLIAQALRGTSTLGQRFRINSRPQQGACPRVAEMCHNPSELRATIRGAISGSAGMAFQCGVSQRKPSREWKFGADVKFERKRFECGQNLDRARDCACLLVQKLFPSSSPPTPRRACSSARAIGCA